MAWIDDRIWCHPKYANVSKPARWAAVSAIAYSSGFHTNGRLTNGQVTQVGATTRERRELVTAELWHEIPGGIEIHDWDQHNGRRDARKASDRDRKRRAYWKEKGTEPPQETTRRNQGETVEEREESRTLTSDCSERKNLGLLRAAQSEQPQGIAPTAPTLKEIA